MSLLSAALADQASQFADEFLANTKRKNDLFKNLAVTVKWSDACSQPSLYIYSADGNTDDSTLPIRANIGGRDIPIFSEADLEYEVHKAMGEALNTYRQRVAEKEEYDARNAPTGKYPDDFSDPDKILKRADDFRAVFMGYFDETYVEKSFNMVSFTANDESGRMSFSICRAAGPGVSTVLVGHIGNVYETSVTTLKDMIDHAVKLLERQKPGTLAHINFTHWPQPHNEIPMGWGRS